MFEIGQFITFLIMTSLSGVFLSLFLEETLSQNGCKFNKPILKGIPMR